MTKYVSSYGPRSRRQNILVSQLIYPNKILYYIVIGFLGALIVAYIFLVNDTTTGSYKLSEVENRIETFQRENKQLELKVAELKSMKNVQARLVDLDFVPVANVDYARSEAPSVALR